MEEGITAAAAERLDLWVRGASPKARTGGLDVRGRRTARSDALDTGPDVRRIRSDSRGRVRGRAAHADVDRARRRDADGARHRRGRFLALSARRLHEQ